MGNRRKGICWECNEERMLNSCGICEDCWEKFPFIRKGCSGVVTILKGGK